ncbi:hypothetical protein [Cellulomonas sp. URHD0024]|uniref:hypothetical protein n=1 Tax=Cellulomonas sp. URHD0024 TaxID=1302620 RepID=UPI0004250C8A|nr:hypothetical protein [Cellulomonas sp. URHD0024]
MTRTRLTRVGAVVALTCTLVAGPAAASFAAEAPQPTATSQASLPGDGHRHPCTRAAHVERRLERALARIQGDAQQKGSVAWLEARAAEADQAGKTERAAALRARADRRESRARTLTDAQARLAAMTAKHCPTPTPTAAS